MTYAFDTNVLIHILNNNSSIIEKKDEAVASGDRFAISPVVDYELRRGFFYKPSKSKEYMYYAIAEHYGVGEMTVKAWRQAAYIYSQLRRNNFTVGDADILIAAFCMANGYTLVTANTKDFENIDGLQYVNWVE